MIFKKPVSGHVGVAALACAAIASDGYDLTVYGAAAPNLLRYPGWALTPSQVGVIASATVLGMCFGAVTAGMLADRLGVRRVFMACVAWFSVAMIACAVVPSPTTLGIARFIAGLGLGGVVPTAVTLTVSAAPPGRRHFLNGVALSGLGVGGILATLSALAFLDEWGWRGVFLLGGIVPLVTVVPVAAARLGQWAPEPRRTDPASGTTRTQLGQLVGQGGWRKLIIFTLVTACCQILSLGLLTWLPVIMRTNGYSLGSALLFMLVYTFGSLAGASGGAWVADRVGARRAAASGLLITGAAILGLAVRVPLPALYVLLFVAGAGVGVQPIIYGFAATSFPSALRAGAVGMVSGVGRLAGISGPLIGGLLIGRPALVSFAVFAAFAVLGAVITALFTSNEVTHHDAVTSRVPAPTA
ncbi:MFS transporter [Streptomyces sp. NBC_00687]|uniref:MFS transporter n=1 Tax=Streptomyces sp. NBC_00687 TaxID=2975807 RepID=UPI0022574F0C|nr:MFS transporter [Streptomyces sp. NBC_00687]MCX4919034.1 MFS transporter [Streptomyces sp. NBC_00687]